MVFVPAPERQPFPYGLFSVLSFRDDAHFEMGIEWESLGVSGVSGIGSWFEACEDGEEPVGIDKGFANLNNHGDANSFTIYGSYKCAPVGYDIQHGNEMAAENLQVREEARVERALWTGDLNNRPSFKDSTVASGSFTPVKAIAEAEKYIEQKFGSMGVIHIPRHAVVYFLQDGLVKRDGDRLYTVLGTPVVAGSGYPETNPATGAAGLHIVATGTFVAERGEVFGHGDKPLLDFGHNDLYAIAERTYSLGFEPEAPLAVPVTVS